MTKRPSSVTRVGGSAGVARMTLVPDGSPGVMTSILNYCGRVLTPLRAGTRANSRTEKRPDSNQNSFISINCYSSVDR